MATMKRKDYSYRYSDSRIKRFRADDQAQGMLAMEQAITRKRHQRPTVLVAIVGGSATGKTSYFTPWIASRFDDAQIIAEDDYCLGNSGSPKKDGIPNLQIFDAYDPKLIRDHLTQLRNGHPVEIPQFAYDLRERRADTKAILPASVIIMEGCYLLQPSVRDLFDVRVFIDTDDHSRFVRRMLRKRRNPAQTDAERLREYCEAFYNGYYAGTFPFANNADIILENSYSPLEARTDSGKELLSPHEDEKPENIVSCNRYVHPSMSETETLLVTITVDGMQSLQYRPNYTDPTASLTFKVSVAEYGIDLTRIGYTQL
ncbi:MAG TPA: hypothetical protein VFZ58_00190 [Candidatus Saccharimonadales bacterium]